MLNIKVHLTLFTEDSERKGMALVGLFGLRFRYHFMDCMTFGPLWQMDGWKALALNLVEIHLPHM